MALLHQPTLRKTGALRKRSDTGETGPGELQHTLGEAEAPTGMPNKRHRLRGQVTSGIARESRLNMHPGKTLTTPGGNRSLTQRTKPGGNNRKTCNCGNTTKQAPIEQG
eukprot:3372502-Amphidinium_carterae.1